MKGQHFIVLRKLFVAEDAGWVVGSLRYYGRAWLILLIPALKETRSGLRTRSPGNLFHRITVVGLGDGAG